ncbi:MAG: hypothetical protein ACI81R_001450 [Bradymonadia bacterium]|jgi:hypothetical protein
MFVWRENDLNGSAVYYAKDEADHEATERVVDLEQRARAPHEADSKEPF